LDLLRRAKVFASGEPALLIAIVGEMVSVAPAAGCADELGLWREQLTALQRAQAAAAGTAAADDVSPNDVRRRRGHLFTWRRLLVVASIAAAGVGGYFGYQWWRRPAIASGIPWEQRLNANVGLAVWFQRFETNVGGQAKQIDIPLSTGSAFAVSREGIMVTNKHVSEAPDTTELSLPPEFIQRGRPVLKVCFGPRPEDQVTARVVHQSADFDFAVLEVPRTFDHPMHLSDRQVSKTTPIVAVGFPGVVCDFSRDYNTSYWHDRLLDFQRTGRLGYSDWFTPDTFEPVVTSGIVSAANRSMEAVKYHLFDAKVGHGNSGGPLMLPDSDEVIGIVTLKAGGGVGQPEEEGYNYALAVPQLRGELRRYLPREPTP
jgi:S1-C subfamily serine protease